MDKKIAAIYDLVNYDGLGRIKTIYKPHLEVNKSLFKDYSGDNLNFQFDLNAPFFSIDYNQPKTGIVYDAIGRVVKVTGPDGSMTTYEYDQWQTTMVDPNGHKKVFTYDAYGQLIQLNEYSGSYGVQADQLPEVINLPGMEEKSLWDKKAKDGYQLGEWLNDAGSSGEKTIHLIENSVLTLLSIDYPLTTKYRYDIQGNLIAIINPQGNTVQYTYDTLGRRIAMEDPDMGGLKGKSWEFKYDLCSNLAEIIDAKGQLIGFEYDALNRPIKKRFYEKHLAPNPINKINSIINNSSELQGMLDGVSVTLEKEIFPPVTWVYDNREIGGPFAKGKLVQMKDGSGSLTTVYNKPGQPVKLTRSLEGKDYTARFEYDKAGRITSIIYPDNEKVLYSYSRDGTVNSVKIDNGSYLIKNTIYDALGALRYCTYGNGLETRYEYNTRPGSNQLLKGIATGFFTDSSSNIPNIPIEPELRTNIPDLTIPILPEMLIQDISYNYDLIGNITARKNCIDETNSEYYAYDAFNRLTQVNRDDHKYEYIYDALGNLLKMANDTHEYKKDGWAGPHAVTDVIPAGAGNSPSGIRYTYDANGNRVQMVDGKNQKTEYVYDYENHLLSLNQAHNFTYDGFGVRVKAVFNQKESVLSPFPFYEIVNGKTVKYYFADDMLIAKGDTTLAPPNDLLFYHTDHLGSLQLMSNREGKAAGALEYDPFGETRSMSGGILLDKYRFTGQSLDATGLYYYGARYYDPSIGKFITPDPLDAHVRELGLGDSQRINLYSYVHNNPVNYVDPLGIQASEINFTDFKDFDNPIYDPTTRTWGEHIPLSNPLPHIQKLKIEKIHFFNMFP